VPRLPFAAWIGNAFAALCGRRGAVTAQAQAASCSRQTVYDHADKVQQALDDAHGPLPERLRAELQALRDDNGQLWRCFADAIDCPQSKCRRFAVAAAAMGLSLLQILALLAILLPANRLPGRSTLGRWVQQAARQAGRLLQVLDAACQDLVLCLCIDEIFFHRQPVLMAVEPFSMTWVLAQRVSDRSGPTWAKALAAWPQVRDVAADGGTGLELGLELAARKRQEDAAKARTTAVPLSVRLDVFHTRQEGERALRQEWARAEEAWQEAEKADRAKGRYDRTGSDRRRFSKAVTGKGWAKAIVALEQAEAVERAWGRAVAALEVFRPDGQLNDRSWARAQLEEAVQGLPGPRWAKTRRMLLDERTLTFLDRLHEELALAEPEAARREGLVALWRWQRSRRHGEAQEESACALAQGWCVSVVQQRLGEGWQESYRRVAWVLSRVVRASSVVECLNSVVRMHQARHRNLSQDLLDLKRLYWNCRAFVSGQRRQSCPYKHLGLKLPTYDPWDLLQMDPKQLEQLLSSS
jgi:hypothetical protein